MNKLRGLAGYAALLVVFLLVGSVDANGQSRASSVENPQSSVATKLGITSCPMGTATNVQGGIAALDAWSQSQKPNMASATALNRLKYEYYRRVVTDVRDYSIAVELSLLNNLEPAFKSAGDDSITMPQLAALYNATKPLFGMCQ